MPVWQGPRPKLLLDQAHLLGLTCSKQGFRVMWDQLATWVGVAEILALTALMMSLADKRRTYRAIPTNTPLYKVLAGLLPVPCYTTINFFTLKFNEVHSEVPTNSCCQPFQGTLVFRNQGSRETCGLGQTTPGSVGGNGEGEAIWSSTYRRPISSSWLILSVGNIPAGNLWKMLEFLSLY